jgi:hypothetical protein
VRAIRGSVSPISTRSTFGKSVVLRVPAPYPVRSVFICGIGPYSLAHGGNDRGSGRRQQFALYFARIKRHATQQLCYGRRRHGKRPWAISIIPLPTCSGELTNRSILQQIETDRRADDVDDRIQRATS